MKKLLCLGLVLIMVSGCDSSHNIHNQTSSKITISTNSTIENGNKLPLENFDIYTIGSMEFSEWAENNAIDVCYLNNYPSTGNTGDMMEYESEYASIWKNEMDFSTNSFCSALKDEDKVKFNKLQNDWYNAVIANLQFEQQIFSYDYDISLGSSQLFTNRSAYRSAFRNRTLHIKYLHYVLETQKAYGKDISQCDSVKMLFEEITR